jgi:hypothetical protein
MPRQPGRSLFLEHTGAGRTRHGPATASNITRSVRRHLTKSRATL